MIYFLLIPAGIILGFVIHQIGLRNQLFAYLIGILPYSVLFWLSLDNRELWDPYRGAVIFSTIIAIIVVILLREKVLSS